METNISGIYVIKNIINGHSYVGSAVNIRNRWQNHTARLRSNTHKNEHLQRAWNKYGENYFVFEVLEEISDKNDLLVREQHFIDSLHPEYNACPVAGSRLNSKASAKTRLAMSSSRKGHRYTFESIQKMSNVKKGKKFTDEHRHNISIAKSRPSDETRNKLSEAFYRMPRHPRSRSVVQLSLLGEAIQRFDTIQSASLHTGAPETGITAVCRGKRKSAGGFIWKYADPQYLAPARPVTHRPEGENQ